MGGVLNPQTEEMAGASGTGKMNIDKGPGVPGRVTQGPWADRGVIFLRLALQQGAISDILIKSPN